MRDRYTWEVYVSSPNRLLQKISDVALAERATFLKIHLDVESEIEGHRQ